MDRQNTNEGSTTILPKTGDTPAPGHVPTDEERRRSEAGVAERGADAAAAVRRRRRAPAAPPSWQGQAVADAPDGQAEEDADIAAGRVPGYRSGEDRDPTESPEPVRMAPDEERQNEELKREAAAEDHEADRAQGRGTAPKNM